MATPAARQSLQMPDGSVISFKGVDFGKNHDYPPNARFFTSLRRWLPSSVTSRLGFRGGYAIGQDSIFFWYRQEKPSAQPVKLWRVIVDDNGVESAVVAFGCSQRLPDGSNLEGCGTTAWPRRSRRVGLRFYQSAGTNPPVKLGEFWAANPHRVQSALWKPHELPATNSAGDLQIALLGVEFGRIPVRQDGSRPPEDQRDWGYLRFRIVSRGLPTSAWEIRHCSVEDASGNKLESWEHSFTAGEEEILPLRGHFQDGSYSAVLPYGLWSGEAAWRVTVVFSPRSNAQFMAQELCVISGVRVPAAGEVIRLDFKTNVNGGDITLDAIQDSDPSGNEGKFPNGDVLTMSPMLSSDLASVLVRVVDDKRRTIQTGSSQDFARQTGPRSWRSYAGIPLSVLPSAKTLEITFGITTNRVSTFLALPPKRLLSTSKE